MVMMVSLLTIFEGIIKRIIEKCLLLWHAFISNKQKGQMTERMKEALSI